MERKTEDYKNVLSPSGLCHLLHLWLHPSAGLSVHVQPWWHHAWLRRSHSVLLQCQWLPARHRTPATKAPELWGRHMQVSFHFKGTVGALDFWKTAHVLVQYLIHLTMVIVLSYGVNISYFCWLSKINLFLFLDIRITESLPHPAHLMNSPRSSGPFWQPALPLLSSFRFSTKHRYHYQSTYASPWFHAWQHHD